MVEEANPSQEPEAAPQAEIIPLSEALPPTVPDGPGPALPPEETPATDAPGPEKYAPRDRILQTLANKLRSAMKNYNAGGEEGGAAQDELRTIYRLQADHLDFRIKTFIAVNGGLLETDSPHRAFLTTDVVLGDPKRLDRYGLAGFYLPKRTYVAGNLTDTDAVKVQLHEILEEAFKGAEDAYTEQMHKTRRSRNPKPWHPVTTPPVNCFGPKPVMPFDLKKVPSVLERVTQRLYDLNKRRDGKEGEEPTNKIEEARAKFTVQTLERRAVAFERDVRDGQFLEDAKPRKLRAAYSDVRTSLRITAKIVGQTGMDITLQHYSVGLAAPFPDLETELEKMKAYERHVRHCLRAVPLGGIPLVKVIASPALVSYLVHEALGGHLLSAKEIIANWTTVFRERFQKRVLPEFMHITNDPGLEGGWGSYPYDAELVKAAPNRLVVAGVPMSYLHDLETAGTFRVAPTGNSRIGYDALSDTTAEPSEDEEEEAGEEGSSPEPRTGNLDVWSSSPLRYEALFAKAVEDALADGDEMLMVLERAMGGEVDKKGVLIRNLFGYLVDPRQPERKYWAPVMNFQYSGTPITLLSDIAAMSYERMIDYGECGADSGWVFEQIMAPWAYIRKMEFNPQEGDPAEKEYLKEEDLPDDEEDDAGH